MGRILRIHNTHNTKKLGPPVRPETIGGAHEEARDQAEGHREQRLRRRSPLEAPLGGKRTTQICEIRFLHDFLFLWTKTEIAAFNHYENISTIRVT